MKSKSTGLFSLRIRFDDAEERLERYHLFDSNDFHRPGPDGIHYVPGKFFLGDEPKIQHEFCAFLAEALRSRLMFAIETQRYEKKYKPLSDNYAKYKLKYFDNDLFWYRSGEMYESLDYWYVPRKKEWVVGVDPEKRATVFKIRAGRAVPYKKSKVYMEDIIKFLEFGTLRDGQVCIPPRPLFRPAIRELSKHVNRYYTNFLKLYYPELYAQL